MTAPLIATFGGGTDSTAMLLGMADRGVRPEAIVFADTGSEQRHTYAHLGVMQAWCERVGFPRITVVKQTDLQGEQASLETQCLKNRTLPSLAYGFKGCSLKMKRRPSDNWVAQQQFAIDAWDGGLKVVKAIGFEAGEERRAKIEDHKRYEYVYPLIEWGWDRDDCIARIAQEGLQQPGKSSCFFCPSMKRPEIIQLHRNDPELFWRAIAMEDNAQENLGSVRGLGRYFAWRDMAGGTGPQLFASVELACECGS